MLMATTNQAYIFLSALYMGILVGVTYDIYRSIRILSNPPKVLIGIMDILFWLTAAMLSIIGFFYISDGEIRLYSLLGLALGWIVYLLTFSRYVIKFIIRLLKSILWIFTKIIQLLVYPFQILVVIMGAPVKLGRKCKNILREKVTQKNINKKEDSE